MIAIGIRNPQRFFRNTADTHTHFVHGARLFTHGLGYLISLQAHAMVKRTLRRDESLVARVWALHARDESRHVVFDDLMLRRARLPGIFGCLPGMLAMPLCAIASVLLNLNEIWAARQLGVDVGYHELPDLMRRTTAPFKRRVFGILFRRSPDEGGAS